TQEPKELRVEVAATAEFSVTATGKNLKYLWQRNKTNLAGVGTESKLTLSNAQKFDEGMYRCIVSGDCGVDTSEEVRLSVGPVSVPVEVSESGMLSISNLAPNPVSSGLTIEFSNRTTEQAQIMVIDALGTQVFQTVATDNRMMLNLASIPSGTYRLVLRAGSDVCYKPFVVVK
ncbi:MAG: T9SS type A sorting domain-containing protein, partial [Candidatus Kapabacteria bacterium]|nr:T9SS type A sorting domain-containing protein [Candidatus Kapabacteria bacterium]